MFFNDHFMTIFGITLFKYLFVSYIDLEFIGYIVLSGILFYLKNLKFKICESIQDNLKYIGHTIFAILCLSTISNIVIFFYNIIFYFGFINTIVFVYLLTILSSHLMLIIDNHYKNFIINVVNKGYQYISKPILLVKSFYEIYVKSLIFDLLKRLFAINTYLLDNKKTTNIKIIIKHKFNLISNKIISLIINKNFQERYNMDFLKNNSIDQIIDDDIDVDIDTIQATDESYERKERFEDKNEQDKNEQDKNEQDKNEEKKGTLSKSDLRSKYHQKIANKRILRQGRKNNLDEMIKNTLDSVSSDQLKNMMNSISSEQMKKIMMNLK